MTGLYFPRHIAIAPTDSGIVCFSGDDATKVDGQHAYELIVRLVPLMDGTRTLEQVLERVPEKARPALQTLLQSLIRAGVLLDGSTPAQGATSEGLEAEFADLLDLAHRTCDRPIARFLELRAARILVVAPAGHCRGMVGAVVNAGAVNVDCATWPRSCTADPAEVAGGAQIVTAPWLETDAAGAIQRYAAVISLGSPDSPELRELCALCIAHRVLLLPVTLDAHHSAIGPIAADAVGACWSCYVSRLMTNDRRCGKRTDCERPGAQAAAGMIATLASRELFLAWMRWPDVAESSVLDVHHSTLEVRRRPVVKLTDCAVCSSGSLQSRLRSTCDDGSQLDEMRLAPASVLRRLERLTDSRNGVFAQLDEGDLRQEPLNQCRATLFVPRTHHAPLHVFGAGPTPNDARLATYRRALEWYGSLVPPGFCAWRWLAGEDVASAICEGTSQIFAVAPGEDVLEAAQGHAIAQHHTTLRDWSESVLRPEHLDPAGVALIEYLRALAIPWKIESTQAESLSIYRFWTGETLAAVVSGRNRPRLLRDGLQEIWLRSMHGSTAMAGGSAPLVTYVPDTPAVRNISLPPGVGLYQVETPEYRAADFWRFCLLVAPNAVT